VFDFRYHVASLAAVFLALVIGILVGVGVSGRGLVDKSERKILQNQIAQLQSDLGGANAQVGQLEQQQQATRTLVQQAYPALMAGRLAGAQVAVLVVGRDDGATGAAVQQALDDAGGAVVRYRAIRVPIDPETLTAPLAKHKQLLRWAAPARIGDAGRELGLELVRGGKTPLWDALSGQLVDERRGTSTAPASAVVVIRTAAPQGGATSHFLVGLYSGLGGADVPAVGVEVEGASPTAIPAFTRSGLSTVDDVDQPLGRLALALLLEGVDTGHFGVGAKMAPDGLLPAIPPLAPSTTTAGGA
jgi:hypothetical protein